jgi:endogenous inhibitor of DNA gyrase (YacG/DUF329 family)
MLRCPNCRKEVRSGQENASFPFCSARCRAIDLSRWFTGTYRVAGEPAQGPPPQPADKDDER